MFTRFMDLALELRLEIWKYALPKLDLPGLAIYRKGCWQPRFLTPSDWDYDPDKQDNIRFEYRYGLLPVCLGAESLALVNREALGVVLSWAQRNPAVVPYDEHRLCFHRRMNCETDTLYLPMDKLEEFDAEPWDRESEGDMVGREFGVAPFIHHFAISEDFFYGDKPIPESWVYFDCTQTMYVIVGQQPDEHCHWEIVDRGGRPIIWDIERGFELGDGETILNEDLCQRIMADKHGLGEPLKDNRIHGWSLKIQIVTVEKR